MNDITFCTSEYCPYKHKCHRRTGGDPDDPYQSYANFEYTCNETSGFNSFIPIINERN